MDKEIIIDERDFIRLANGEAVEKQGVKVILSEFSRSFIEATCPVMKGLQLLGEAWDRFQKRSGGDSPPATG